MIVRWRDISPVSQVEALLVVERLSEESPWHSCSNAQFADIVTDGAYDRGQSVLLALEERGLVEDATGNAYRLSGKGIEKLKGARRS